MDTVTELNISKVLEFERIWWNHAGFKDEAIRDRFSLSPTRYYQKLNQILDGEAALKSDPITVNRLRRIRTARRR